MAGKGGGAWKVAYADFVTAMMAFFMVMWLVGQKDSVKESVAQYFQDPYGESDPSEGSTEGAPLPPPGRGHGGKPKQDSPSKDPHDAESRKPRVVTIHSGERTAVGAMVSFADDETTLGDDGKRELNRIMPKLAGMPQKIEIRGHASRRPSKSEGPPRDAWQVSYDRCLLVMRYLQEQGIEPNRIRLTQAGVFEPLTIRNDVDDLQRNARVEIFLLAEMADDFVGTPEERAARFQEEEAITQAGGAP